MWAVNPKPVFLPALNFPFMRRRRRPLTVSVNSQNKKHENTQKAESMKNQLSGLDVLLAMERAAAQKSTGKRNDRKRVSAAGSQNQKEDEEAMDYTNVRPLHIQSDWIHRLDQLEKRIDMLSETK